MVSSSMFSDIICGFGSYSPVFVGASDAHAVSENNNETVSNIDMILLIAK